MPPPPPSFLNVVQTICLTSDLFTARLITDDTAIVPYRFTSGLSAPTVKPPTTDLKPSLCRWLCARGWVVISVRGDRLEVSDDAAFSLECDSTLR